MSENAKGLTSTSLDLVVITELITAGSIREYLKKI